MLKLLRPQADGDQDSRVALKRAVAGTAAALVTMAVLTVAMQPRGPGSESSCSDRAVSGREARLPEAEPRDRELPRQALLS